ncbi:MAG: DUF4625 domain-containing protein [Flavobacteriales bacterium]
MKLDTLILALPMAVGCAIIASCEKDVTSNKPEIHAIVTPSEHGNGLHAQAGATNRFYITMSDDEALQELQVKLITPGEFHSHVVHGGGLIPAFKAPNIGDWNPIKSLALAGTDTTDVVKFTTPANISGAWNLNVMVMDADGNLTYREETVVIQNDSIPAIIPVATVPTADADGVVRLNAGDYFTFEGSIADGNYLETVGAIIYLDDAIVWQQTWTPDNVWMFELSDIVLPSFTQAGEYQLIINASDKQGWHNWVQADISVIP